MMNSCERSHKSAPVFQSYSSVWWNRCVRTCIHAYVCVRTYVHIYVGTYSVSVNFCEYVLVHVLSDSHHLVYIHVHNFIVKYVILISTVYAHY